MNLWMQREKSFWEDIGFQLGDDIDHMIIFWYNGYEFAVDYSPPPPHDPMPWGFWRGAEPLAVFPARAAAIEEIRYDGMTLREMLMKLDSWM